MKEVNTFYPASREEWRAWLEKNHTSETEVWVIHYKKHTGKPSVPYNDAVEEALCFGWIDSTARSLDDERFMQKYTPRKKRSNWSEPNRKRVAKLIAEGKMAPAGLSVYYAAMEREKDNPSEKQANLISTVISPEFVSALELEPEAKAFFESLAPSHRLNYIRWINAAKRPETTVKRINEAIGLLRDKQKLGLK